MKICRFKTAHPIRRAVAKGELPGIKPRKNRMIIPASAFWKWFHRNDVKPRVPSEIELPPDMIFVPGTETKSPHFRVKVKEHATA